ncbi:MAG: HAMP domain-containing histidine kinase [Bacillus sp. (in: Bacteria)]|nr:HAMP domain-containing histidine kinase [Bacillus sp. (in: firmicutes)]MCM1425531.1 HAMP domain-containing histidine kinase [Eubacterium sp.]
MKTYRKFLSSVILFILLIFAGANLFLYYYDADESGRPYRVEIERLARKIEESGWENIDLGGCEYVVNISSTDSDPFLFELHEPTNAATDRSYPDADNSSDTENSFFASDSDYIIREIDGVWYRFDYVSQGNIDKNSILLAVNTALGMMAALLLWVLLFIKNKILSPFEQLSNASYELAKGNLTTPLPEHKSRFFGKFVWGINLLREHIEEQKSHELALQKEKKTLLLSLSHDIKTPLSAVKLYAKALTKNLYQDRQKQLEIAENIHQKADEIESYVAQIITASKEDFLSLEVQLSEFYLTDLMRNITDYYREKLSFNKTDFTIAPYENCLLIGDLERAVEMMQNVMENAIKYGDGDNISLIFSEEENCRLITIKNSGCTLTETELPHIFESFWRGTNAGRTPGSGLGLYICRQLMHKMNGDIFAKIEDDSMCVTLVFGMAG